MTRLRYLNIISYSLKWFNFSEIKNFESEFLKYYTTFCIMKFAKRRKMFECLFRKV